MKFNIKNPNHTQQPRNDSGAWVATGEPMGQPVCVALPLEIDKLVRSLPDRSAWLRSTICEKAESLKDVQPRENLKDRLNRMAATLYLHLGCKARKGFDFTLSQHPTEKACFAMAEAMWEEFMGDSPDWEGEE